MRAARGLLIGSALLCALCVAAPAAARVAAQEPQPQRTFATAEECMGSAAELGIIGPPTCTQAGNGPWIATYDEDSGFTVTRTSPSSGAFGAFLLFALLWAATPAIISGVVASNRQQNVGLAVVLGFFLGWIGLVIVLFAFKPGVIEGARSTASAALAPTPAFTPPSVPRPGGSGRDSASRLAELEELKVRGLITEREYAARRTAILDEI